MVGCGIYIGHHPVEWRRPRQTALGWSTERNGGHRAHMQTHPLLSPFAPTDSATPNGCTSFRPALAKQTGVSLAISPTCVNYYVSRDLPPLIFIEILETRSPLPMGPFVRTT